MGWVSVDKQLPPEIDVVFYIEQLGETCLGTYNKYSKKWIPAYSESYFSTGNGCVTHWRLMPDPPEELF